MQTENSNQCSAQDLLCWDAPWNKNLSLKLRHIQLMKTIPNLSTTILTAIFCLHTTQKVCTFKKRKKWNCNNNQMSTSVVSKTQKLADLKAKVYSRTILPNTQMRAHSFSMALLANIQEQELVKIKTSEKSFL